MKRMVSLRRAALLCVLIFLSGAAAFPQQSGQIRLYNEMSAAYNSGFYPGTVKYAQDLMQQFPYSIFIGKALLYEGESLFRLGRTEEAAEVLREAELQNRDAADLLCAAEYWQGRVFYAAGDYEAACTKFYAAGKTAKNNVRTAGYYNAAVLYAGRSYYKLSYFDTAASCFSYVVSNGTRYTRSDYADAVVSLMDSWNNIHEQQKTADLFSRFSAHDFTAEVYNKLSLLAGEALESLGAYRNAYTVYCSVLENGSPEISVKALGRCYRVSAAHYDEVGDEPGDVLIKVQDKLAGYPELVAEFWTRLGIDACRDGNVKKALSYFNDSDKDADRSLKQLNALYRADSMSSDGTPESAKAAAAYLSASAAETKLIESDDYFPAYMTSLAEYAALQSDWQTCSEYSGQIQHPDAAALYRYALAAYMLHDFEKSVELLEPYLSRNTGNLAVCILYARALSKTGRLAKSAEVFSAIEKNGQMDDSARLDYSKVLLLSGRLSDAYDQAVTCPLPEAQYIAAIASFNSRNWSRAESLFDAYRKNSAVKKEFRMLSFFYSGYARYRSGDFRNAYADLSEFLKNEPSGALSWNAAMTAANAAVQLGNFSAAAAQAENAVKTAPSAGKKHDAVLLSSGIYADAGNFSAAVEILEPYVSDTSGFGLACRYQKAQIFVKEGKISDADAEYADITRDFPDDPLAEESLYRRGELYYGTNDYQPALSRFTAYQREYPSGRFSDSAMYFSAGCLSRTGAQSRAILMYTALLKRYPGSTYSYSSLKNLVDLYTGAGDYGSALETAREMLNQYADQAKNDAVDVKVNELQELAAGLDSKIVGKKTEYTAAGESATREGRILGTELAALYNDAASTKETAAALALELFNLQKENIPDESPGAARNALLLGFWYRKKEMNKKSADMYLSAARYFRMNNDAANAAQALYGAADAFGAAGMPADAKDAADTLKSLYPESREAKAAQSLTER